MTTAALGAVQVSAETDGAVVLTLSRPPANALSGSLISRLTATLEDLAQGPAVVLTGAGDRFFCAGGDLKEAAGYDAESMAERMTSFHALLCALEKFPRPLVCAVNGWCVGGGIEMALFSDFVYASSRARFVFPEVDHGMLPAGKGIARVREAVGDRGARRLLLGGKPVGASEAKALGIVDEVVEPGELLEAASAQARAAAAKPPAVFAALKLALLQETAGWPDEKQLRVTAAGARTVFDDPAARAAREAWNG
ncbi:enoyl-CoA hydratase/isomerase family protein [Amycolatopsis dendrobii]|uniref:Enoyl-CoA hydratase/isomerase family protein n=1 Tax=Amycolatopsis dendrobii TaxID=2760662 RepID=A0A7W3VZY4_9PSEU|nr:enoyl-CoA hydratase/isomerase family protein [Amycolatopsis dendrobii]MBB1156205.1 enoyl-CoA hydratase/isomerase family protein [Amycolatopsis dendrobii]